MTEDMKIGNKFAQKHGLSHTHLYHVHEGILSRCNNPNRKSYKDYGGRGIKVCDEWNNVENFYKWAMDNGYKSGLQIDRIDTNKDYFPENCRWVSPKIQQNNRRNNKILTYKGLSKTVSEWADYFNVTHNAIYNRVRRNWDINKIFETSFVHMPQRRKLS